MDLPIAPPFAPMEAETAPTLPPDRGWQYEPKWDGFRCLAFRDGDEVYLQSKAGKPIGRYFPDVVDSVAALRSRRFVLDGEIVIPVDGRLSFDELLLRVHPAASRVRTLVEAHRARFMVFDLLVDSRGHSLVTLPLSARRKRLEAFARTNLRGKAVVLSRATRQIRTARAWLEGGGDGDLDGVIAKRLDLPYRSAERGSRVQLPPAERAARAADLRKC